MSRTPKSLNSGFSRSNTGNGQGISAISPASKPKGKILVVHDRLNSLSVMHDILVESGYSTLLTMDGEGNGQGTVTMAREEAPDLILLDINAPETNGHLICQQLRAHPQTRHIPIIVVSPINDILTLSKFISMRVNGFIHKPFQIDDFLKRIQRQILQVEV